MRKQPKHVGRGGARKGAGKKALPADQKKGTRCYTYDADILVYLDSLGGKDAEGKSLPSASKIVGNLIRRSPAFRKWAAERNG